MVIKKESRDFPGGPVVKNLPSNAGDTSLIPGQGTKIPHAVWHSQKKKFFFNFKKWGGGFPGGAVVKNLPANAGDMGSSLGLGRSHMPRSN